MTVTRSWRRWQDWVAVVVGVLTALSFLVFATSTSALVAMIVLGALLFASGLWSLALPGSVASEWVHIVLGALLFISPWVLTFTDLTGAAWTSWVAGGLAIVVGAVALPGATETHRGIAPSH